MTNPNEHHRDMDRELVSGQPHELKYLAETHGASVEEVEAVIREVGSRSRRRIEEALDQRFQHRSRSAAQARPDGSVQSERGMNQRGPSERGTGHLGAHERQQTPRESSNDGGSHGKRR